MQRLRVAALAALSLAALPAFADRAAELSELRGVISERRDRVERYEREERGLLEALDAIERTAEQLAREVTRASARAIDAQVALQKAESEAEDVARRLARTERAMAARANALYRTGRLGVMPVLFAADGLRDFLSRVQTLRRLLSHDATLLAQHRAESRALIESRERAALAAQEREAAREAFEQRSGELTAERARKQKLVSRLGASRARERAALAELETAARALEETVAALPSRKLAGGILDGPSFASQKGRLPYPVHARIARDFGRVVDSEFQTETFRKGADFDAPAGTPVRSVAAGHVRYAGRFRGYGNTVIIDHGGDYFTVSAHLSRIDVELGDPVQARASIGAVGDSGSLSGAHLYFEVRRGAEALDPERWLDGGR
jgi:septal ring factor EnvC (AmiA/AmiB activator)